MYLNSAVSSLGFRWNREKRILESSLSYLHGSPSHHLGLLLFYLLTHLPHSSGKVFSSVGMDSLSEQVTWRSLLGQLPGLHPENMPMVLTRGGKQNVSALSLKFATKNIVLYASFKDWVMNSSQSQTSKMKTQFHVSIFLLLLGNPG